eukprot:TRINITY_DN48252_c0_g1_i1.p1 TRINITY_DN48252_c0_g1~~TRINITY_DN48252_c0_g1_i1.p1  ORF type:complete len:523 (+),score=73.17 TRINITY_DN48252_c0_g1_i1:182-1570(+)
MSPNGTSLSPTSACSHLWAVPNEFGAGSMASTRLTLTYPELLAGQCRLSSTSTSSSFEHDGFLGIFIVASKNGQSQVVQTWQLPVTLRFDRSAVAVYEGLRAWKTSVVNMKTVNLGAFASKLELFSATFASPKEVPNYKAPEEVYLQQSLQGSIVGLSLVLNSVWLTQEGSEGTKGNISVAWVQNSGATAGAVRAFFPSTPCSPCAVHALSTVVASGGRRLESTVFHSWASHPINIRSPETHPINIAGNPEDAADERNTFILDPSTAIAVALAASVLFSVCVFALTCILGTPSHVFSHRDSGSISRFFLVEATDVGLDWAAWAFTKAAGDLSFTNDSGSAIEATITISSAISTLFFLAEICAWCCGSESVREILVRSIVIMSCFHLCFEDALQSTLYAMVAATQASDAMGIKQSGFLAVTQSVLFMVVKIADVTGLTSCQASGGRYRGYSASIEPDTIGSCS